MIVDACGPPPAGRLRDGQAGNGSLLPAAQRGRGHHGQTRQSNQDRLQAVIGIATVYRNTVHFIDVSN
jgi:hypothetical protein